MCSSMLQMELSLCFWFQFTVPSEIAHYLKHFPAGNLILNSFQPFHINALTCSDLSDTFNTNGEAAIDIVLWIFFTRTSFILLLIRSFFLLICSCVCIKIQAVSLAHFSFSRTSASVWIDNTWINPRTASHTVWIMTIKTLIWFLMSHFVFFSDSGQKQISI